MWNDHKTGASVKRIFVTGISTEVGKTLVSAIITEALEADYWKPVQAGDLDYSDSARVASLMSNPKTRIHPNVYSLKTPMSPHASAVLDGIEIQRELIREPVTTNHLVIEGAGGLLVPLNQHHTILDLILPNYTVVLVSRHYLGSINHTLLSLEVLKNRGLDVRLIFNGNENPASEQIILEKGKVPLLGRMAQYQNFDKQEVMTHAREWKQALLSL